MVTAQKIERISAVVRHWLGFDVPGQARHDYEDVFLRSQSDLDHLVRRPLGDASMLVLGCGYTYPDVVLFSNVVRQVTGMDVMAAFHSSGVLRTLRDNIKREGGILRGLSRTLLLRRMYSGYYRHLAEVSGTPVPGDSYNLLSYGGDEMPFAEGAFDVVLSNAVLEHVDGLEMLVRELHRVTKVDGVSYHLWHNYYSFSGGHAAQSLCATYPWGHLTGEYETRGLNKLMPSDVESCFSECFDVEAMYQVDERHRKKGVDEGFRYEREDLLSEEIEKKLYIYPRELLLTRAYLIIGRRRP